MYRVLRQAWSSDLLAAGFKRLPRTSCAWYAARDTHNLVVAVTVSNKGWSADTGGSSFVTEFEATNRLEFGWQYPQRGRLGETLPSDALSDIVRQQNRVVTRLHPPTSADLGLTGDEFAFWMREFFQPVTEVVPNDLHFRYFDAQDIEGWARLLLPWLVPEALAYERRWLTAGGTSLLRSAGYKPSQPDSG